MWQGVELLNYFCFFWGTWIFWQLLYGDSYLKLTVRGDQVQSEVMDFVGDWLGIESVWGRFVLQGIAKITQFKKSKEIFKWRKV